MSDKPERYIVPAKIGPRAKGDFRTIPISMKRLRVLATLAVVALSVWAGYIFTNAWVSVALASYFAAVARADAAVRQSTRERAPGGGRLQARPEFALGAGLGSRGRRVPSAGLGGSRPACGLGSPFGRCLCSPVSDELRGLGHG